MRTGGVQRDAGVVIAQQMEAAHQVLVEYGHLAVEHENVGA